MLGAHGFAREKSALFYDKALKGKLGARALEEFALHAVRCGQSQHQHRLLLPYAVAPVHRLHMHTLC